MKAEDIYELLKPGVRRLNKREKIKLYSKIISESHPAFRIRKRGRMRNCEEIKQKLKKDLEFALAHENSSKENQNSHSM